MFCWFYSIKYGENYYKEIQIKTVLIGLIITFIIINIILL